MEKMVLYGVFTHVESPGNFPVLQSFRNPVNDLLLPFREQEPS
jgi:hypothetical protein